jgi:membrane-associated phospholipid phosphatase
MMMLQSDQMSFFQQLLHLDYQLTFLVNREMVHPVLDDLFLFLRESIFHVPLYFFIIIYSFQVFGKKAIWWVLGAISLIALCDLLSSHVIKAYFNRPRPCRDPFMAGQIRFLARYCGANGSFTSSHAVNHFAFATYVASTMRGISKWFNLLFVWALAIAYAQVYVGVHYPSDVLAGAFLGIVFGLMGAQISRQALSLQQYSI